MFGLWTSWLPTRMVKRHANPLGKLPAVMSIHNHIAPIHQLPLPDSAYHCILIRGKPKDMLTVTYTAYCTTEATHKVVMIGGKCSLLQSLSVLHMHLHIQKSTCVHYNVHNILYSIKFSETAHNLYRRYLNLAIWMLSTIGAPCIK